jgi:hypothetical protein
MAGRTESSIMYFDASNLSARSLSDENLITLLEMEVTLKCPY